MVKEAVMIQHQNPNSEAFVNAHRFLDEFRSKINCIDCCMQLSSKNQPDEIRHFALQTLNMAVNKFWKSFTLAQKVTLKQTCVEFIKEGSKGVLEEKEYVKEKIVQMVCSVVIKGWPNNWQSFFKELIPLSDYSSSSLDLVLRILKNMRSETEINYKLPLQLRENIKLSLRSYNNEIYSAIEATLNVCHDRYTSSSENLDKAMLEKLIIVALDCLIPNIQFPMECLFRDKMIDFLCSLATMPPFFKKAFDCLILICNKKAVVPQNISTARYKDKFFMIWKVIVNMLMVLLSDPNLTEDDGDDYLELIAEASLYIIRNHKQITYRKVDNEDLKEKYVILLIKIVEKQKNKPLIYLFELFRTLFEVRFFTGMANFRKICSRLFAICFERLDKPVSEYNMIEDEEEVKKNLSSVIFITMRLILLSNRTMFIDMTLLKLHSLLENDFVPNDDQKNKFGLCTKDSRHFLVWDNFLKVLRIPFYNDCFNRPAFKRKGGDKLKEYCEKILDLLLSKKPDHLVTEMINRFLFRFASLLQINRNAFQAVLTRVFSTFDKFQYNEMVAQDAVLFRNTINVRKSAVHALISLSRLCRGSFVPIYDLVSQQCKKIQDESHEEEDLSGLFEFLLSVSEDGSLKAKRNNMIASVFGEAVAVFVHPSITRYFTDNNLFELLENNMVALQNRQKMRVALNTINALLRGITKASVSFVNETRLEHLSVLMLNSFQYDEIWSLAKRVLPSVIQLLRALNDLHQQRQLGNNDLSVLLFSYERAPQLQKFLETNGENLRLIHFKRLSSWIFDMRDFAYSLLALTSNLSDTFFSDNSQELVGVLFHNINYVPMRVIKSLSDKVIAPLTIRCSSIAPQYLNNFVAPLLKAFFETTCVRLTKCWNFVCHSDKTLSSQQGLEEEIEFQDQLRSFTKGVAKLLFSFTLRIELVRVHDLNKRTNRKRENENRLNLLLLKFLLSTEKIFEPLFQLLLFFLSCPDSVSRNNIYRFLLGMADILRDDSSHLQLLARFMVEAIKIQPQIKELDASLVDFVNSVLFQMTKMSKSLPREVLSSSLPEISEDDLNFLLNVYLSKDKSLQKKKTKQFLFKISGDEGIEIFFENSGTQTNSIRRKVRNSSRNVRREKTDYITPNSLNFITGDGKDDF